MYGSCCNAGWLAFYCLVITSSVQAQIVPDKTLPINSTVVPGCTVCTIEGGTVKGSNLFHSFSNFSIPTDGEASFNNAPQIENIFSRVTGPSVSNINGIIRANSAANLFLINSNGVIFGPKAELQVNGSFVVSTASSLLFNDGYQFSATNSQTSGPLTINTPIGLQFGETAKIIRNQSQVAELINIPGVPFPIPSVVGLQVKPGRTLALVGGDVLIEKGGELTASGGRIELGSVAGSNLVSLTPIPYGWALRYEGVQSFQNIRLTQKALVSASGSNGSISGDIHIQGRRVELAEDSSIFSLNDGNLNGGSISVSAEQLILQDGSLINVGTFGAGQAGDLTVIADSIELTGAGTSLFTQTQGSGKAGSLTINAERLIVQEGAQVAASTFGDGDAGNLTVEASEVDLSGTATVNVVETDLSGTETLRSQVISSGLYAQVDPTAKPEAKGDAGNLTIEAEKLIVRNGARATVSSSRGSGNAGDLKVGARLVFLDNQGKFTAETATGEGGGNITLQDLNLLLLSRNSEISTSAGGNGNGGNITIDADSLVALDNSDITANAIEGRGGNVRIQAQGVFGTSNITASSELGIDGVVEINAPDVDPSETVVNLPEGVIDVSGLVVQTCPVGGGILAKGFSEFVLSGRGGLPPTPGEVLKSGTTLVDLGTPIVSAAKPSFTSKRLSPISQTAPAETLSSIGNPTENRSSPAVFSNPANSPPAVITEAQGWIMGPKGEVVLTAQTPIVTPHGSGLTSAACDGS